MESENVFHPSRGVHRHPLVLPTDKCLVELVLDGVHEGVVSAATDSVEVVHVDGPDHEAAQSVLHDVVHLCLESRHCLSFLFTVNHIDGRFKGINSLSLSLSNSLHGHTSFSQSKPCPLSIFPTICFLLLCFVFCA